MVSCPAELAAPVLVYLLRDLAGRPQKILACRRPLHHLNGAELCSVYRQAVLVPQDFGDFGIGQKPEFLAADIALDSDDVLACSGCAVRLRMACRRLRAAFPDDTARR